MALDAEGDLWVADTANNRIQEFSAKDKFLKKTGSEGTGNGEFKQPMGIAVGASANIFVADTGNNRVEEFNEKGKFLATFGYGVSNGEAKLEVCTKSCKAGIAGSGNGQFSQPRGIAVAANGDIWVADYANSRVEEFTESGEYITKIGSYGKGNGEFEQPEGVTIDPVGNIWVSDAALDRIQEFSPSGAFLTTLGVKGAGNGQFYEPWGVAFTSAGQLYVADVKTVACRSSRPLRDRVTKARTTRARATTPRKAKQKSRHAANTPNGQDCRAKPNP
jgi:DNA-binding beta-propeller fold protein YncE